MIKYTTPTLTLRIKNYIFPENCKIFVTFDQGSEQITKENPVIRVEDDTTLIDVTLSQEETKIFKVRLPVSVQVNWITETGIRNATTIVQTKVIGNLLDEVIEYGD